MSFLKMVSWVTTIIFVPIFFLTLVIFHPLQMIALRTGYQAHKMVVDMMIYVLNHLLIFSGNWIKYNYLAGDLPRDKPIIVVSNHQSIYDIPAIGWILRNHHPKYIAKKSLAKGYPSISYNIRNGGSIAIDRKDQKKSARQIMDFCKYLNETNRAGVIFAEGRRAKDGQMRSFKRLGLSLMLKKMPDAVVVPIALDGFWKFERHSIQPIPAFNLFTCTVLPIVERAGKSNNEIIEIAENRIRKQLGQEIYQKEEVNNT